MAAADYVNKDARAAMTASHVEHAGAAHDLAHVAGDEEAIKAAAAKVEELQKLLDHHIAQTEAAKAKAELEEAEAVQAQAAAEAAAEAARKARTE